MTPQKLYANANHFRQALEERLKNLSRSEGIEIMRLRRQVAFDRLLVRFFHNPNAPWLLKGGYAMELRIDRARTTKDLDLSLKFKPTGNLLEMLQELTGRDASEWGDFFSFRIGEAMTSLDAAPEGGERFPVEARLDGRTFIRFHLDIGIGDATLEPSDLLQGKDWLGFAGVAAPIIRAIPAPLQFAEKLHAYTLPRTVPNSRVKDVIDMLLLIRLNILTLSTLRKALHQTFARRKTHAWPEYLPKPPIEWETPFQALAEECGLDLSLGQALSELNQFYSEIGPSDA